MRSITITFDGDPYVPQRMEKVARQWQALERLKPGSTFTVLFDDRLVKVAMANVTPARLQPITDRVPCSDEHAMALSDGIEVDCDFCR